MQLNLVIQVYHGGDYWREAWQSVQPLLSCFQGVYISINYSEIQERDIAVIAGCDPTRVHWICHRNYMTACEHGKKIYQWLISLPLHGHLLFLCHDDLLLKEGVEEILSFPGKEDEAVFGSFLYFDQDHKYRPIGVRQFSLASGEAWDRTTFARYLFDNRCMISVSGIVLPVAAYTKNTPVHFSLKYGYGAEVVHLINPHVKKIRQSGSPSVKVRLRPESEGHIAQKFPLRMMHDRLFYCLRSFVLIPDSQTRISIVRALAVAIREHPGYALLALFPAMYSLLKERWCPLQLITIFVYLIQLCVVRGYDFLLRKTGMDC